VKKEFTKSQKIKLKLKSATGLKRVYRFKSSIIKPAASLGIHLKRDYEKSIYNTSIFIEKLIEHSHADVASKNLISMNGAPDAALFLSNDRIVAINDKNVKQYNMGEIVKELRSIPVGKLIVFELIRITYLPKRTAKKARRGNTNREQKETQQGKRQQNQQETQYKIIQAIIHKSKQNGLGIRVVNTKYGVVVDDVINLHRNDIQQGDTIVSINGVSLKGLTFDQAIQLLKVVPVGSKVKLVLERRGSTKRRDGRAYRNNKGNRQRTRRPDAANCLILGPEALKRKIGVLGVGEITCAPAKFGPPLPRNTIQSILVVPTPYHGCSKLNGNYKGKILLIPRGKCYFHEKAIYAQRAGAMGVIISNSREDGDDVIFEMELPQASGTYNLEPVTIPLVMISQRIGLAISRFSGSAKIFAMQGLYNTGQNRGSNSKYGKRTAKIIDDAPPIDVHADPIELFFDFSSGSLELNVGKPGIIGNPRPKGHTVHLERLITLQDVYVGGKIKIKYDRHRLCPQCHGRGGIEGGLKPCPHCSHTHNSGRHVVSDLLGSTFSQKKEKTCSICQGHGEVLKAPEARCPTCNGRGIMKEEKELTIVYPIGMHDGFVKVFPKLGSQPRYGTPGDVVVTLKTMLPHGFQRSGADLITATEISFSEALLGFNRTIFLPNGNSFQIQRTGITRPGTTITKYGYGIPYEQELNEKKYRKRRGEAGRIEGGNIKRNVNDDDTGGNEIPRGNVVVRVIIDFNNLVGLQKYSKERVRAAFNNGNSDDVNSAGDSSSYFNETSSPSNGTSFFNNTKINFGNIFRNAFRN
jgi:DnaJ-class molecular chaperone